MLRAALGQAERDELVARNVAKLVRVPFPRPKTPRIWSLQEAQRFLESSQRDADPLHAAYVLSLVLGLRRGEVLGLAWEDVDLDAGEVRIRWQLQRAGGQLVRRPTKTVSSDAVLPLPQVCIDALRSHRTLENRRRLEAGPAWHDSGLVFTTRYGLPIDPRNFHRMFKERAIAAGVPAVSVHSTRHVCASSRRTRGASQGRHAGPATQPDRSHHGYLLPSGRGRHARRSQPTWLSAVRVSLSKIRPAPRERWRPRARAWEIALPRERTIPARKWRT